MNYLSDLAGHKSKKRLQMERKAKAKRDKSKLKVLSMAELELQNLRDRRKLLGEECSLKRQNIDAELETFYTKHPQLRPAPRPRPQVSPKEEVPCTEERFASCDAVVYDYDNGNRRIVQ